MSDERLTEIVGHLLHSARQACSFVEGMSKDDFLADVRTQQAVVMRTS